MDRAGNSLSPSFAIAIRARREAVNSAAAVLVDGGNICTRPSQNQVRFGPASTARRRRYASEEMITPNRATPHSSPAYLSLSSARQSEIRADGVLSRGANCVALCSAVRAGERFGAQEISRTRSFLPHSGQTDLENIGNFGFVLPKCFGFQSRSI
jgi:hypothetical protein